MNRSNLIILVFSFFLVTVFGCSKADDRISSCEEIIIDKDLYQNGVEDPSMVINSIEVSETCLVISLSYSGGCQDHIIQLVTDGEVIYTNPPRMELKLIHDNTDPCQAFLTYSHDFDLLDLGLVDYIELSIKGYPESIIVNLN